ATRIFPGVFEVEAGGDVAQHLPQAVDERVMAGVGRCIALEVLGGDCRSPEDELVVIVAPVQDRAGHRVVERFSALGLPLLVLQDLWDGAHTAASFAFFFSSKNCSSSVEPCSAVVEALPPVTTCVISSK